MILRKQVRHALILSVIMSISAINRLNAPLVKNTPYGMDFYEFMSYVFSAKSPLDILCLPHGPIFYFFLFYLRDLGVSFFLTLGTYILPTLFSLTILPLYFLSKKIFQNEEIGYLSLLIAGSTGILIHQTGATVIPEALGLMFAGISSLYLFKLIEGPNLKNFVLLTIFLIFTSLAHHLTTIVFYLSLLTALLPLLIFSKFYPNGKNRLLIAILATCISMTFTFLYWYFFTFNYTLKLMLNITSGNYWPLALALPCGILMMLIFPFLVRFLSRPFKVSVKPWAMSLLMLVFFSTVISYFGYSLFLTPVIFYGLPMVFTIVPLSWVGLRAIFQYEKSYIKKCLILAQTLIPVLLSISLLLFRGFAFVSYRMITTSLFFSSPLVAYGILKTIQESTKSIRFLLTVTFACLIFSLSLTSTPSKEFLCGIEESYSKEELNAARFIAYHLKDELIVDTDVRFGNLLLFYSEGEIKGNIGNRMYFQNISDNLLVQMSHDGFIYSPKSPRIVIITRSMLKEEGGTVVLPFYMELKPIELKDVNFLNNYEAAFRILDYQDVMVFILEWQYAIRH